MPKGLICSIYDDKRLGNCSNHGLSFFKSEVTLVGPGIPEIFKVTEDRPAVQIVTQDIMGKPYLTAYEVRETPLRQGQLPKSGPMFGGTFIYSSDSRFPADYPVPLHDRYEY